MSETTNPINFKIRHGIGTAIDVLLAPMAVAAIASEPIEEGIRTLLSQAGAPADVVAGICETLADPYCVIEVRQGDSVRVLTRRQGIEQKNVQLKPPVQTIEIGIAKAQSGG